MNQVAMKQPNPIAELKEVMDNGTEQFRWSASSACC
jgi:hypothetical protein